MIAAITACWIFSLVYCVYLIGKWFTELASRGILNISFPRCFAKLLYRRKDGRNRRRKGRRRRKRGQSRKLGIKFDLHQNDSDQDAVDPVGKKEPVEAVCDWSTEDVDQTNDVDSDCTPTVSHGIKQEANETSIKTTKHLAKESFVHIDEAAVEDGKVANLPSDKYPTDEEIFSKDTPSVTQDLGTTSVQKASEDFKLVMETATAGGGAEDNTGEKKDLESPKKGRKRYKKKAIESPWTEWKKPSEYKREMKEARSNRKANSQATVQLVAGASKKVDGGEKCLADKKVGGTHNSSSSIQTSLMKSTGDGSLKIDGPVLQTTPKTPQIIQETNNVDSVPQTTDEQRLIPTEAVKEEDLSNGKHQEESKIFSRMFPEGKRHVSLLAHYGITPHRRITIRRSISAPSSEPQRSNADWKVPVTYKKTLGHKRRRKSQQPGSHPCNGPSSCNAPFPEKDLTSSGLNISTLRLGLAEHYNKDQDPSLSASIEMTTHAEVSEPDQVCTTPQIDESTTSNMISISESTLQKQSVQDQVPAPVTTIETPTEEETEADDVSTLSQTDAVNSNVTSVSENYPEEHNTKDQDPSRETTIETPTEKIFFEAEDVCTTPQTDAVKFTSNITSVSEKYLEEQNTSDKDPSPETTFETPAKETVSDAEDVCTPPQADVPKLTSNITLVSEIDLQEPNTEDQDPSPEITIETPRVEKVSEAQDVCTTPQTDVAKLNPNIISVSENYLEEQNTSDKDPSPETTFETPAKETVSDAEDVCTPPQADVPKLTSNITLVSEIDLQEPNTEDQDPSPEITIETPRVEKVSEAQDVCTTPQTDVAKLNPNIISVSENYLEEQNTSDKDPSPETTFETPAKETVSDAEDVCTPPQADVPKLTSNITLVSEIDLEEPNTEDQDPSPEITIETPTENTVSEAEDVCTTAQTDGVKFTSNIISVSENYLEEQNTSDQDPSPETTFETPAKKTVSDAEDVCTPLQTDVPKLTSNITLVSEINIEEPNTEDQDPSPEITIETPTEEIVSEAEDVCTTPQTDAVKFTSNIISVSENYQEEQNTSDQNPSPETTFETPAKDITFNAEDVCTPLQTEAVEFTSNITSVSENHLGEQNTMDQDSSPKTSIETPTKEIASNAEGVCTPPQTDAVEFTSNITSVRGKYLEEQNTIDQDPSPETCIETKTKEVVSDAGEDICTIPQIDVAEFTSNITSVSEIYLEKQNTIDQDPSPETPIETPREEIDCEAEDVCTPPQTHAVELTSNVTSVSENYLGEQNTKNQDPSPETSIETPTEGKVSEAEDVCTPPQTDAVEFASNITSVSEMFLEEQNTIDQDPSPDNTIETPTEGKVCEAEDVCTPPQTHAVEFTSNITFVSENDLEEQNTMGQDPSSETSIETPTEGNVSEAEDVCTTPQTDAVKFTSNVTSVSENYLGEQNAMDQDPSPEISIETATEEKVPEAEDRCTSPQIDGDIISFIISGSENNLKDQSIKDHDPSPSTTIETARIQVSKAEDVCTLLQTDAVNFTTNLKSLSESKLEEQNTVEPDPSIKSTPKTPNHIEISETGNVWAPQTYAVKIAAIITSDGEMKEEQNTKVQAPSPSTTIETARIEVSKAEDVCTPLQTDVVNFNTNLKSLSESELEEQNTVEPDPSIESSPKTPNDVEVSEIGNVWTPQTYAVNLSTIISDSEVKKEEQNTKFQATSPDTTIEKARIEVSKAEDVCTQLQTDAVNFTTNLKSLSESKLEEQNTVEPDPSIESSPKTPNDVEVSETGNVWTPQTYAVNLSTIISDSEVKKEEQNTKFQATSPDTTIEKARIEVSKAEDVCTQLQTDAVNLTTNLKSLSDINMEEQNTMHQDSFPESLIGIPKHVEISETGNVCMPQTYAVNISTTIKTSDSEIQKEEQNTKGQASSPETTMKRAKTEVSEAEDVYRPPQTDAVNITSNLASLSEINPEEQITMVSDPPIVMPTVEEVPEIQEVCTPPQSNAINITSVRTPASEDNLEEQNTIDQESSPETTMETPTEKIVCQTGSAWTPPNSASESAEDEILGEHREYVCKSTQTDPVIVISLALVSERITEAEHQEKYGTIPEVVAATDTEPGTSQKSNKNVSMQLQTNLALFFSNVTKVSRGCLEEQNTKEPESHPELSGEADAVAITHTKHTNVTDQLSEIRPINNPSVVTTVREQNTKQQDPFPETAIEDDAGNGSNGKDIQNIFTLPQAYTAEVLTVSGCNLDGQSNESLKQSTCPGDQQGILSQELFAISTDVQTFTVPPPEREDNTDLFIPPAVDQTLENITSPSFKGDEVLPTSKTTPEFKEDNSSERSDTPQTLSNSYQESEVNMQPEVEDVTQGSSTATSDYGLNKKQLRWLARRQRQKAKKRAAKEAEKARAQIESTEAVEEAPASSATTAPPQTAEMTTHFDVNVSQKETETVVAEATTQPSNISKVPADVSAPHVLAPPLSAVTITFNNTTPAECDSDQTAISSEERKRLAKIGRRKRAKAKKCAAKEAEMDKGESGDVENAPKPSLSSGTTACALPVEKTTHSDVTTTQEGLKPRGGQVTLPFYHIPEVPNVISEPKVQYPLSSEVNTNQMSTKTDTTPQDAPKSHKSTALGSTDNILESETISQLATSEQDASSQFVSKEKDSSQLDGHVADDASVVTTESSPSVAPHPTFDFDHTISLEGRKRLANIGRRKRAKAKKHATKEAAKAKAETGSTEAIEGVPCTSGKIAHVTPAWETTGSDVNTTLNQPKPSNTEETDPPSDLPQISTNAFGPEVFSADSERTDTDVKLTTNVINDPALAIKPEVSAPPFYLPGVTIDVTQARVPPPLPSSEVDVVTPLEVDTITTQFMVSESASQSKIRGFTSDKEEVLHEITKPSHSIPVEPCSLYEPSNIKSVGEANSENASGSAPPANTEPLTNAHSVTKGHGSFQSSDQVNINATLPPKESPTSSASTPSRCDPDLTISIEEKKNLAKREKRKKAKALKCAAKEEAEIGRAEMVDTEAAKEMLVSLDKTNALPVELTSTSIVNTEKDDPEPRDGKVSTPPSGNRGVSNDNSAEPELLPLSLPVEVNSSLKNTKSKTASQSKTIDDSASEKADEPAEVTKRDNLSHSSCFEMSTCSESTQSTPLCNRNIPDDLGNKGASMVGYDSVPDNQHTVTLHGSFQPDSQVTVPDLLHSNEIAQTAVVPGSSRCDPDQQTVSLEDKRLAKSAKRKRAKARKREVKKADMIRAHMVEHKTVKEIPPSSDIKALAPTTASISNSDAKLTGLLETEIKSAGIPTPSAYEPKVSTNILVPGTATSSTSSVVSCGTKFTKIDISPKNEAINEPALVKPDVLAKATKSADFALPPHFEVNNNSESSLSTSLCDRNTPDVLGNTGASSVSYDFVPNNLQAVTVHQSSRPNKQATIPYTQHSTETSLTSDAPSSSGYGSNQTLSSDERRRLAKKRRKKRAKARKRAAQAAEKAAANNTRESTPSHNTMEATTSNSEEIILNFDDDTEFKIDWEAEMAKPFYNTTEIYPPRVPIPKWAEWDFSKVGIIMWLVLLWGIHQCYHWPISMLIVLLAASILLTVFTNTPNNIAEIKYSGLVLPLKRRV